MGPRKYPSQPDQVGKPPANKRAPVSVPGQPAPAVQRKVGFELEVQLPVSRYVPGEEAKPITDTRVLNTFINQLWADVEEKYQPSKKEIYTRVYGHEDVYDAQWHSDGWRVTADNAGGKLGGHKANLEVQTRPIDTERQSAGKVRAEINDIFESIKAWLGNIKARDPKKNRIKVSDGYTVGFPNVNTLTNAPKDFLRNYKWDDSKICYDAYVQVNLGVPLHKVNVVTDTAMRAGNAFRDTEEAGAKVGAAVASKLLSDGDIDPSDKASVSGFLSLLCSAVAGAAEIPTTSLVKKLWSLLPKSGIHTWWTLQLALLSANARSNFAKLSFRDKVVTECLGGLKISPGAPLLGKYGKKRLQKITKISGLPAFSEAISYTAASYCTQVLAGTRDFLVELSLQHQTKTGSGTSMLDVDMTPGGMPLGVMEIRNLRDLWQSGSWKAKALKWARTAYELSRGDWQEEQKLQAAASVGTWDDYMRLRQYIGTYMPEF